MIRVRSARTDEADQLTALCIRSKAHWGYDSGFMREAAAGLTVTTGMIEQGRVLVAEGRNGGLLGVACVEKMPADGKFDLSLLFVEPSAIHTGVGYTLFEAAVRHVDGQGGRSLSILADPFAEGFYRHLGAVRVGEAPSDTIPGRHLPLLEYKISWASPPVG
jgi:GNAT superfamily N-acetyltransferase